MVTQANEYFSPENFNYVKELLESYQDSEFRFPYSSGEYRYDYDHAIHERIKGHRFERPSIIQAINCCDNEKLLDVIRADDHMYLGDNDALPYLTFHKRRLTAAGALGVFTGIPYWFWTTVFFLDYESIPELGVLFVTKEVYGDLFVELSDALVLMDEIGNGKLDKFVDRILSSKKLEECVKQLEKTYPGNEGFRQRLTYTSWQLRDHALRHRRRNK